MTTTLPRFGGYASVFNVRDQQGDVMLPGAFRASLKQWQQQRAMPALLWQHDSKQPIGQIVLLREDTTGLYMEAVLTGGVQQAAEAQALVQQGALRGLSIGYQTRKAQFDKTTAARLLYEVMLWEVSLVTFAANPQAQVLDGQAALMASLKRLSTTMVSA